MFGHLYGWEISGRLGKGIPAAGNVWSVRNLHFLREDFARLPSNPSWAEVGTKSGTFKVAQPFDLSDVYR